MATPANDTWILDELIEMCRELLTRDPTRRGPFLMSDAYLNGMLRGLEKTKHAALAAPESSP